MKFKQSIYVAITIVCAGLLSWGPAVGGQIYNFSPDLSMPVATPTNWLASNGSVMECVSEDQPPVLRDDFDEIILALDPDLFTGINLEPSSGCWKFVNGRKYPKEATKIFKSVAERIKELRPGMDFCFYTLPQETANLQKNPELYAEQTISREVDFLEATEFMDTVCISGYWKDISFEAWKARNDIRIGIATAIHGKRVIAFVWDGTYEGSWKKGLSGEQMDMVLDYYQDRGIPVGYWSYWSDSLRGKIASSTQWSLYKFYMGW